MAVEIRVHNPNPLKLLRVYAGTGGLTKGQLAVVSSGLAVAAAEGIASATILGVAMETCLVNEVATIYPITSETVLEMAVYQGGATDACTNAMLGTVYDIYVDTTSTYLDLNDTTGAFLVLIGHMNDGLTALVKPLRSVMYI